MPSLMFAIMKEEPPAASSLDNAISPAWDETLKKALARNRDDRDPTVKEFIAAVRDAPSR
jgi:hypothetical protein